MTRQAPQHWSPILDPVKPVVIPAVCFAKHPDRYLNCTKEAGHLHYYRHLRWTNTEGAPQW
jgi:hypothetical protein